MANFLTQARNLGNRVGATLIGLSASGAGNIYDNITPGSGSNRLTDLGNNIANPRVNAYGESPAQIAARNVGTNIQPKADTPSGNTAARPGPSGAYTGGGQVLGSSTGGAPQFDPYQLSLIDQGINTSNNALGLLDRQQDIGLENVGNSYNSNLNRLLGTKATADRNYNTTRTQTTQDNVNARNEITSSVGRNANALQRLLGQRGAGNSSAAQIVAPYGAALQGTQQLRGVTDAFGRNMQSLDTNYQDFNRDWQGSREDLDRQKFQNENSIRAEVAGKRASLLSNLGQLQAQRSAANGGNSAAALASAQPYLNQANTLQSDITNYGRQYANPININTPNYTAPELAQYQYQQGQGPTIENPSAYTDAISPYLSMLLGRREQNQRAF